VAAANSFEDGRAVDGPPVIDRRQHRPRQFRVALGRECGQEAGFVSK
jgi:hypothetical protein